MHRQVIQQALAACVGDARTPLYTVTGTVLLNFVLDPLFIMGFGRVPGLGVSGAAVATVVTQGLAALIGLAVLFSGRYGIKLKMANLRPDFGLLWRLVRLGLPSAMEQSTRALGLLLVTALAAGFGTVVLAAYGIGIRMLSFVIIPALGMSQATQALVGQNIGAGKVERAEHTANLSAAIAFCALTAFGIVAFVFAEHIVALFVPGAVDVIEHGASFVRITALTYGFIGIQLIVTGVFRGSGNTHTAMALALVSLWVLQFPLTWLLSERTALGATGIWVSYAIQNVVTAAIALIWFRQGSWKQRNLLGPVEEASLVQPESIANLR